MPSLPLSTLPSVLLILASLAAADYPILSASFTWYHDCTPSHLPACGPTAKTSAPDTQIGYAATNRINYGSGSRPINGVGKGCGQCWHIQPLSNPNPMNGNRFGNATVVKINDECTDGGYCDQTMGAGGKKMKGNTKYGKEVHFDLCTASGVADVFFGDINEYGQLLGLAQQVGCGELTNGEFGMDLPPLGSVSVDGGGAGDSGADPARTGSSGGIHVLDTPQTYEVPAGNRSKTYSGGVAGLDASKQLSGKLAGYVQHSEQANEPGNDAESGDDSICEL